MLLESAASALLPSFSHHFWALLLSKAGNNSVRISVVASDEKVDLNSGISSFEASTTVMSKVPPDTPAAAWSIKGITEPALNSLPTRGRISAFTLPT